MSDTEVLVKCPWCNSVIIKEYSAIYATMIRVEDPEMKPLEVKVKVYQCMDCGREFTERDANTNSRGG